MRSSYYANSIARRTGNDHFGIKRKKRETEISWGQDNFRQKMYM